MLLKPDRWSKSFLSILATAVFEWPVREFILLTVFIIFAASAALLRTTQGTSDASPIIVKVGSVTYDIPQNYLRWARIADESGGYAAFSLSVLLPELAPRTAANSKEFLKLGVGNKLNGLVEYGVQFDPPQLIVKRMLALQNVPETDYKLTPSGYRYYRFPKIDMELFTVGVGPSLFFFTCSGEGNVPSSGCTVTENIGNNTRLEYWLSSKYKNEVAAIDRKLRSLIASFER